MEKSAFRAPKSQELVQFRKAIEADNLDLVNKIISENPRYLISSGDTPSILKEGTRYNAIHVTALNDKPRICEFILDLVSKPDFISFLHGKKNLKTCQEISNTILDLYLNMPEKGRSDTPLHLAVKYGHIEVVKVLTSYPQCKMSLNLDGFFPKDVICSRMKNPTNEAKDAIASMLKERFFVPVIRAVDSSMPPIIGEPFSSSNLPKFNSDPLSPEVSIQAYAGPMDKEQAQVFRRRWKTPPRLNISSLSRSLNNSSSVNGIFSSPTKHNNFKFNNKASTPIVCKSRRLFTNSKSMEMLKNSFNSSLFEENSELESECEELKVIPIEENDTNDSQHILDDNVEGSTVLNVSSFNLGNLSMSLSEAQRDSPSFKERHAKLADTEKGLEVIGRWVFSTLEFSKLLIFLIYHAAHSPKSTTLAGKNTGNF